MIATQALNNEVSDFRGRLESLADYVLTLQREFDRMEQSQYPDICDGYFDGQMSGVIGYLENKTNYVTRAARGAAKQVTILRTIRELE